MKKLLRKIPLFFFFFLISISYSQSSVSSEVGVFFGPSFFQTDFGDSGDFSSSNSSSLAFGATHYLKFFGSQYNWRSGTSFFSEHFKLKTEFLYINRTSLKHTGKSSKGSSENSQKLRDMTGNINMYNIGTNLEFYFFQLEDYTAFFANKNAINPFVNIGIHYTFFDPDILVKGVSIEGDPIPYTQLIPKWQEGAINLEKSSTFGVSGGAGVRFGLDAFDLVVEGRYQYFFSDNIDGLNAPDDPANKNNDSMILLNIGVVYVFGKF